MRNRATTSLKRPKFRQSWSKYNLYNLTRVQAPFYRSKNFFQTKWAAKATLRPYHGEQVSEGQWSRMFSRRLRAVVPMDPKYLAVNDGRLESAGRGSGLKALSIKPPSRADLAEESIPYMAMTFAPLERRLDTAIFRALFASSTRQARQMVVHGHVKVNGKNMKYPGYLLNPGDLFQVNPDRVLYATGKPKEGVRDVVEENEEGGEAKEPGEEAEGAANEQSKDVEPDAPELEPRETLKSLLDQSKDLVIQTPDRVSGKRKQDIRSFQKLLRRTLSKSSSQSILTDSLEAQFLELKKLLNIPDDIPEKAPRSSRNKSSTSTSTDQSTSTEASAEASGDGTSPKPEKSKPDTSLPPSPDAIHDSDPLETASLTNSDIRALQEAMKMLRDNPIDDTKPYATPWQPRDYMSAFAFIPRYLEVNQNICSAVYLRHPVARPGLAEVPSPLGEGTQGEAFAWYLRRR